MDKSLSQDPLSTNSIAIIGAGVVGLCSAIELQQAGFQVCLFDKNGIGESCSKGNAGHFATEQVFPLAEASLLPQMPKLLLDPMGPLRISPRYLIKALPWFMRFVWNMRPSRFNKNKLALKALNHQALPAWQALLACTQGDGFIKFNGSLLTFESDDLSAAKAQQAKYQAEGVSVKLLSRNELDALQPHLSPVIKHALYFDKVAHTISPYQLSQHLYEYAKALGVKFVAEHVSAITATNEQVTVSCNVNSYQFSHSLLCAGAFSKTLCQQLGYKVPLDTERGYHYMVSSKVMPLMPVVSFEKKFILTPMEEGLRLAGTVEFAGLNAKANYQRADMLLTLGKSIWPNLEDDKQNEEKRWMGFRPTLPDSLPVIGQAPNHPRVFFNFGHQHLGLTLAAISAKLISNAVTQSPNSNAIDLSPYSIKRFN
jgi:glycine/D-amino acid oxidase-like deaminating enzyme